MTLMFKDPSSALLLNAAFWLYELPLSNSVNPYIYIYLFTYLFIYLSLLGGRGSLSMVSYPKGSFYFTRSDSGTPHLHSPRAVRDGAGLPSLLWALSLNLCPQTHP